MSNVTDRRLSKVGPVLAMAMNAAHVNIDSEEDLIAFKEEFDRGIFDMAQRLDIKDRETFAIEFMTFSNACLFWLPGY
jgi:hypothetical protein